MFNYSILGLSNCPKECHLCFQTDSSQPACSSLLPVTEKLHQRAIKIGDKIHAPVTSEYTEDENRLKKKKKITRKIEIYMLSLQRHLVVFEEAIKRLEETQTTNKWIIFM